MEKKFHIAETRKRCKRQSNYLNCARQLAHDCRVQRKIGECSSKFERAVRNTIMSRRDCDFVSEALLPVRRPTFSDITKYNIQLVSHWSSASFLKIPSRFPSRGQFSRYEVIGAETCIVYPRFPRVSFPVSRGDPSIVRLHRNYKLLCE